VAYSRLSHKGAAVSNTLGSQLLIGGTTISLSSTPSGWPAAGAPFFVVIDPGTAKEEKVCVVYVSGTTLTVVDETDFTDPWAGSVNGRGVDDTTAYQHESGAVIYPVFTAREANQANELVSSYTANGDIIVHGSTSFKKIAVGTNAHVLQADSTVSDGGVKWGTVATAGIADGAVTEAKLASDSVTAAKIAADAVGSSEIAAAAVTATELASDAVTTAKILDGNVTTAKIADDAVTSAKIAAPTLTSKTDSFTLALVDENCTMQCNKATAMTVTVPTSSIAFANGSVVTLMQYGAGQVTVAGDTGVTIRSSNGLKLRTQYSMATLVKISDTEWVLSGDTVV
jgi:hypothetical protein